MKLTSSHRRPCADLVHRARLWRAAVPLLLWCAALAAYAAPPVVILSPRPGAVVHGTIQVTAAPSAEAARQGFSYAALFIDAEGRSISNALPLRFNLDTTTLANGRYLLRIDTFNTSGGSMGTAEVTITVLNPVPGAPVVSPPPPSTPMTPVAQVAASTAALSPAPPAPPAPDMTLRIKGKPDAPLLLLDGQLIISTPPTTIEKGRAIVTLRPLVTAAGGELFWDAAKQQVTVIMDGRTIVLTINSATALVDGKPVDLGTPVRLTQGRTQVPARAWSSVFGGGVEYDSEIRAVMLSTTAAYLADARLDR